MKKLLLLTLGLSSLIYISLSAQQLNTCFPKIDNGHVETLLLDEVNNKLYVGGGFTGIGNYKKCSAQIDKNSGEYTSLCWPEANSGLSAAVPDGNGGWYISGSFTKIGNITRNRIAHINQAGVVTDFDPGADDIVRDMELKDGILYVGGDFTNIGGQARNRIAALDINLNTNNATAWNPDADDIVYEIEISGNTIYVGGEFHNIGGQIRYCLASLDATINTNNVTTWAPGSNGTSVSWVKAIKVSGDTVYVGGRFIGMAGEVRRSLAALDATPTGTYVYDWDARVNGNNSGDIVDIEVNGSIVYVAGVFTTIGGQSRKNVAALDATIAINMATSWNPNPNSGINTVEYNDNIIYVGGSYSTIGGATRNAIAAFDAVSGNLTSWNPETQGGISLISFNSSQVFLSGSSNTTFGKIYPYRNIAQIDLNDYTVTEWNPNANGKVTSFALSGSTLYVGGEFDSIGGQLRNHIAALNTTINTNNATAWNPNANGTTINAIEVSGNTIYVGGDFTTIGGQSRSKIAALDASINTNNATAWNPNSSGTINDILVNGNTIYVAGNIVTIGGQSRSGIAALDATINTNNATAWDPHSTARVNSMALDGTTLYVGGEFTTSIGGVPRNRLAALNTTINTNNATAWNPNVSVSSSSGVVQIAKYGNIVYAVGEFSTVGGQSRNYMVATDATINTNNTTDWYPGGGSPIVHCVKTDGTSVFVGGEFGTIGGQEWKGIAAFTAAITCAVSPSFELSPDPALEHNWFAVNTSTGVAPMSYIWYWGDGSSSTGTNPSHVYDSAGYYNICVTVTDGTGCTNSYCDNSTYIYKTAAEMVTINVVNQLPSAIAERENGIVKIYPNPATNTLTIETEQGKGIYQLQDVAGKLLLSGNVTTTKFSLDISTLSQGIYLLTLSNDGQDVKRKIVKQ